jgi:hypothetical protein
MMDWVSALREGLGINDSTSMVAAAHHTIE